MFSPLDFFSLARNRSPRRGQNRLVPPTVLICEKLEDRATMDVAAVYQAMYVDALQTAPDAIPQVPAVLASLQANGAFAGLDYSGKSNKSGDDYLVAADRLALLGRAYEW